MSGATVTAELLEMIGACAGQVATFRSVWPDGVEVTPEAIATARGAGLDVSWLAWNAGTPVAVLERLAADSMSQRGLRTRIKDQVGEIEGALRSVERGVQSALRALEDPSLTRGSHQPHNTPDTGASATYDGVTGAVGGPVD